MKKKYEDHFKSKKLKFCEFFKRFDQFGVQMKFNIKNNDKHRSVMGSICCIVFSLISIAYIIFNFLYFVTRQNQTLIFSQKNLLDPQPISLQDFNFMFGLGIMYDTTGRSAVQDFKDYFEYTYSYISWDGFDSIKTDGFNSNKTRREEIMLDCNSKYFFNDSSLSDVNNSFNQLQVDKSKCPSNLTNIIIQGIEGEKGFKYIEATIRIKQDRINQTAEIFANLTKSKIKAVFYYINTGLDYEDFNNPIIPIIETIEYYLDFSRYRKLFGNLGILQFSSDENILWNDPIRVNASTMINYDSDFYDMKVRNEEVEDYQNLFSVYLAPSKKTVIYNRSCQKFPDYIANMTGLISQILFIIIIIMKYVNNISARQAVILRIMKFSGNKNFDRDLFLNVFNDKIFKKDEKNSPKFKGNRLLVQPKSETLLSNFEPKRNLLNNYEISKNKNELKPKFFKIDLKPSEPEPSKIEPEASNIKPFINLQIESIKSKFVKSSNSKRSKIKYQKVNSCGILFSCCSKKIKKKLETLELGDKKLNHYLDILTYIKKMNELDCIKYIFMNQDEQTFFNFISSPSLSDNLDSDLKRFYDFEYKRKFILKQDEISNLYSSYVRFNENVQMNSIDRKLVDTFISQTNSIKNEDI